MFGRHWSLAQQQKLNIHLTLRGGHSGRAVNGTLRSSFERALQPRLMLKRAGMAENISKALQFHQF